MGKKAKGDHTPEQPPLDDDPRWLPIEAAHERGVERTGDNDLAVIDLEKLLADGRLPCMRRSTTSEERQRVAAIAWIELIRLYSGKDVSVIYRQPLFQSKGHYIVNPVRGWRFFVWQPVLDRIWPPPTDSAPVDEPLLPIDRAKAALRALYRTKAEMPRSLKAATKAVDDYCQKQGWQPVSSPDTVHRAAEQLGYRAPRKRQ
jgi:hypothetical protein